MRRLSRLKKYVIPSSQFPGFDVPSQRLAPYFELGRSCLGSSRRMDQGSLHVPQFGSGRDEVQLSRYIRKLAEYSDRLPGMWVIR